MIACEKHIHSQCKHNICTEFHLGLGRTPPLDSLRTGMYISHGTVLSVVKLYRTLFHYISGFNSIHNFPTSNHKCIRTLC